jgi:hypothetical protein
MLSMLPQAAERAGFAAGILVGPEDVVGAVFLSPLGDAPPRRRPQPGS